MSKPMSFWTEQDVLRYIKQFGLPYSAIYGEIVPSLKNEELLTTTKYERTGCMFCMYGCHLEKEPNRFQKMKETHPKQWAYMLKPVSEGGLGLKEVLDYIGVPYE
jgi:3'-phosphoadenosine 5'-phosphosulfate sulfotransferase (PAPS reductase)/FAD synthetase